jgi:hypothetical protein
MSMFQVGDIIKHTRFNWFALVLKVEELYVDGIKQDICLYRCHRLDCGGYKFNQIDTSMFKVVS